MGNPAHPNTHSSLSLIPIVKKTLASKLLTASVGSLPVSAARMSAKR